MAKKIKTGVLERRITKRVDITPARIAIARKKLEESIFRFLKDSPGNMQISSRTLKLLARNRAKRIQKGTIENSILSGAL